MVARRRARCFTKCVPGLQGRTFPKKHEGHDGCTIDTGGGNNGIAGSITDQANAPTRLGNLIDEITTDSPTALIVVASIAAFVKDPNYTTTEMSNYLHPNTAGYAISGDSFYEAISAYLPDNLP